jgi:transcription antitermination factor NusG
MDTTTPQGEASWYAVSTRSRQEKVAAAMLDSIGITYFLPLVTEVRRWSDRNQTVTFPLFSCYLFVRIAPSSEMYLRVLKVPGIVNFVGNQNGPLAIPEKEIEDVRKALSHGVACSPHPYLKAGDRVRIVDGALAGIEGTLISSGPDARLVISIEMIQRSIAISIYGFDVEPVASASITAPSSSRAAISIERRASPTK